MRSSRPLLLRSVGMACALGLVVSVQIGCPDAVQSQTSAPTPTLRNSLDREAINEAPEALSRAERAERKAKSARYNSQFNDRDLTLLPPGAGIGTNLCGMYDPTILPVGRHDVIVLATVETLQPYLSANRTAIYTEYRVEVDEVFKSSPRKRSNVDRPLIVDRPGGVLRMRDGRVIASTESGTGIARPLDQSGRYVLFCRYIHDRRDLILGNAFELRDGKVLALWERRGYDRPVGDLPGSVASLSDESEFLDAVRRAVQHPSSPRYFSAPRP